jgi:hypothetical protein
MYCLINKNVVTDSTVFDNSEYRILIILEKKLTKRNVGIRTFDSSKRKKRRNCSKKSIILIYGNYMKVRITRSIDWKNVNLPNITVLEFSRFDDELIINENLPDLKLLMITYCPNITFNTPFFAEKIVCHGFQNDVSKINHENITFTANDLPPIIDGLINGITSLSLGKSSSSKIKKIKSPRIAEGQHTHPKCSFDPILLGDDNHVFIRLENYYILSQGVFNYKNIEFHNCFYENNTIPAMDTTISLRSSEIWEDDKRNELHFTSLPKTLRNIYIEGYPLSTESYNKLDVLQTILQDKNEILKFRKMNYHVRDDNITDKSSITAQTYFRKT